ncbi:MAG: hypothetical protein WKF43_05575 [Acidimicrobiales bacterium]
MGGAVVGGTLEDVVELAVDSEVVDAGSVGGVAELGAAVVGGSVPGDVGWCCAPADRRRPRS